MNPMDRQTEGQKPQVQNRQPGIESDMEPKPLLEDPDVKGSGRLKEKSPSSRAETAASAQRLRSLTRRKGRILPSCT